MRFIRESLPVLLLVVTMTESSQEWDERPGGIVRQVVERYLSSCRLALVGAGQAISDPSFTELVRYSQRLNYKKLSCLTTDVFAL